MPVELWCPFVARWNNFQNNLSQMFYFSWTTWINQVSSGLLCWTFLASSQCGAKGTYLILNIAWYFCCPLWVDLFKLAFWDLKVSLLWQVRSIVNGFHMLRLCSHCCNCIWWILWLLQLLSFFRSTYKFCKRWELLLLWLFSPFDNHVTWSGSKKGW